MIGLGVADAASAIIASASSNESSSVSMSSPSAARPPPSRPSWRRRFGDEEVQLLGDRARAHEGLEHLADVAQAIAGLLLDLGADLVLDPVVIELAGRVSISKSS